MLWRNWFLGNSFLEKRWEVSICPSIHRSIHSTFLLMLAFARLDEIPHSCKIKEPKSYRGRAELRKITSFGLHFPESSQSLGGSLVPKCNFSKLQERHSHLGKYCTLFAYFSAPKTGYVYCNRTKGGAVVEEKAQVRSFLTTVRTVKVH